jgi:hypothetical protein
MKFSVSPERLEEIASLILELGNKLSPPVIEVRAIENLQKLAQEFRDAENPSDG